MSAAIVDPTTIPRNTRDPNIPSSSLLMPMSYLRAFAAAGTDP